MARKPSKKPRSRAGASRKKKPAGAGRSSRRSSRRSARRSSRWRTALKLAALPLVAVALATVFLDRQIVREFEARRWAVPAQVFARPMELYATRRVSAADLETHLARLGYRATSRPDQPGTYRRDSHRALSLTTRPFSFWDGDQPSVSARIRFDGDSVGAIENPAGSAGPLVRLDPVVIGSILPGSGEDRVLITGQDVPAMLTGALLAVEDRRFHDHFGLDLFAIGRATLVNLKAGGIRQGGSTLTQQLVKSYFLGNERTFTRKAREAVMAVLLDAHYDKDELLVAYINEVYLGQDGRRAIHGFGLASRFYFGIEPSQLRAQQVALLVGMIRGPSLYDPRRHPERARERRDLVLGMMAEQGVITADDARTAATLPLGVVDRPAGTGYYPAFMDLVRRQLKHQYRDEDLTEKGLRIFSTLDTRIQDAAQRRLSDGLDALDSGKALDGAAVVTGIPGGEVLALVGGRQRGYEGFNRALDARRPVGSLLKPFVVLRALEDGDLNLLSTVLDEPLSVSLPDGSSWTPGNYDGKFRGDVPVYRALAESINVPVVRIALEVGLDAVADTLKSAGLAEKPPAYPSLSLGALAMSPLDVAGLYGTLAESGFHTPLRAVVEVVDSRGTPLERYGLDVSPALDPAAVYQVNKALEMAVNRGTGRAAGPILPESFSVAGKTGTTDQLRDSWFAGFSDDRVAVVWVGRDDNEPAGLSGAAGALPIWARIMVDSAHRPFAPVIPPGVTDVWVDYESGLAADPSCVRDGQWLAVPEGLDIPAAPDCAPAPETAPRRNVGRRALDWLKRVFD